MGNKTTTVEPPTSGDIIKTRSGTKTWRVLGTGSFDTLRLEGVTNQKFKQLKIDQYFKTWEKVGPKPTVEVADPSSSHYGCLLDVSREAYELYGGEYCTEHEVVV